jgi:hypothetical protein
MLNDLIGRTIGRYQIVEHLGRGGMAEVFKAYQASLDRYVALKLMHTFLAEDSEFFGRFEREAKNIASLRHPNIIQIHDFDREGPTYYMVMEFIDGGTLKDRLNVLAAKDEILPLNEAVSIIKDVGAALAFAHSAGMIHRDIKPANVLIDRKGRVILTDFGIAKMVSSAKFTASGSLLGTPAYMAPEQGLGQPGDHRADIYSLGVMLYQLTTGVLPYEADTPVAVILKHVNEPLPMPRTIKPDLAVGLERIIAKAMAKDAAQRYQSMDDMLRDLNDIDKAALIAIPEATVVVSGRTGLTGAIPTVSKPASQVPATYESTMVVQPGGAAAAPAAPQERRGGLPIVPIILGLILIVLLALVGTAIAFGPQILASLQGPTPTPIIITVLPGQTLPPDLSPEVLAAITRQAATAIAQQATIEALQATDTPAPTQDLTATALACPSGVELSQQTPADNAAINVDRTTPIVLELLNSGDCAWETGTTFALIDGDDPRAPNAPEVEIPPTDAGATVRLEIPFVPGEIQTYTTSWQVTLPDGREVGEPIVLIYRSVPAATPRPTTVPVTRPPNVSPTPVVEGALTGVSLSFRSCNYDDAFYICNVNVIISGGVAPWNVIINGANNGSFTWDVGDLRVWQMNSTRCDSETISVTVIDGNQDQAANTITFNPTTAAIFPGGTVCSLN